MKQRFRDILGIAGAGLLAMGLLLGGMAAGAARLTEERAQDCLAESSLVQTRYEQTADSLRQLTEAAGLEYNPDFADFHADALAALSARIENRQPDAAHAPGEALAKAAGAKLDEWALRSTDAIETGIAELAQQADALWNAAADLPEAGALADYLRAMEHSPVRRMLWPGAVLALAGLAASLAGRRRLVSLAAGCIAGGGGLWAAAVLGAPAGAGTELAAGWYAGLTEFAQWMGAVLLALGAAALAAGAVRQRVRKQK